MILKLSQLWQRLQQRTGLIRIGQNISWLLAGKLLRMVGGFAVGIWVARYLGPERFGLLNFAAALVALFGALGGLGLAGVVVRDLVSNASRQNETLSTSFFLQLVSGVLSYLLLFATTLLLRPEDVLLRSLVAILGTSLLFKACDVAVYWFEAHVMSKYIVWIQSLCFVFSSSLKVYLILSEGPLTAFALVMAAEAACVALFIVALLGRRGPNFWRESASLKRAQKLLKDSWPLLVAGIAVLTYMKIDQVMLGQMAGEKAVGIYSVAVIISEQIYFVPMIVVASVFPSILHSRGQSTELYYERFQLLYDILVWLAVLMSVPVMIFATPLMSLLYGPLYAGAGSVLAIHVWASVFVFLGVASGRWFLAENLQLLSFQRTVVGAVVNIALNFLLIPRAGITGAAWATLISYAFVALLSDLLHHETRINFKLKVSSFNLIASFRRIFRFLIP